MILPTLRSARSQWRLHGGRVSVSWKRDKLLLWKMRKEEVTSNLLAEGWAEDRARGGGEYCLLLPLLH